MGVGSNRRSYLKIHGTQQLAIAGVITLLSLGRNLYKAGWGDCT